METLRSVHTGCKRHDVRKTSLEIRTQVNCVRVHYSKNNINTGLLLDIPEQCTSYAMVHFWKLVRKIVVLMTYLNLGSWIYTPCTELFNIYSYGVCLGANRSLRGGGRGLKLFIANHVFGWVVHKGGFHLFCETLSVPAYFWYIFNPRLKKGVLKVLFFSGLVVPKRML